ncbi:hypothetical protein BJ508DRAFT_314755 [Ascobolus immersus RN42]|uniref:Uncharacterized protein n=1 Tax=Ascobolus immersus RN42 TaxID=1160509 RepID=A0A3N4HFR1_ASCIM|nr:hypothetical protein BJ508DRAFT_314755 [Ascobolus immersus RN42]
MGTSKITLRRLQVAGLVPAGHERAAGKPLYVYVVDRAKLWQAFSRGCMKQYDADPPTRTSLKQDGSLTAGSPTSKTMRNPQKFLENARYSEVRTSSTGSTVFQQGRKTTRSIRQKGGLCTRCFLPSKKEASKSTNSTGTGHQYVSLKTGRIDYKCRPFYVPRSQNNEKSSEKGMAYETRMHMSNRNMKEGMSNPKHHTNQAKASERPMAVAYEMHMSNMRSLKEGMNDPKL